VRIQERIDAEKFYIKWVIAQQANETEKQTEEHPRLEHLVSLHGAPQKEKKEAQTLAEDLVNVKLASMIDGQLVEKSLPSSLTVSNLKILCQRLFRIELSQQKIFIQVSVEDPFVEPITDESRTLSYYGATDGSSFIIERQE